MNDERCVWCENKLTNGVCVPCEQYRERAMAQDEIVPEPEEPYFEWPTR